MNLDDLLLELGISCQDAARRSKIGRSTVYRWMYGITWPQNEQLAKLAKGLNVPVLELRKAITKSHEDARKATDARRN
jgi:transcriptional regulator with XRE-family HTH domain